MKKIEPFLFLLAIFAFIMKSLLVPGGDLIMGIVLSILAMFYYGLGFFIFNNVKIRRIFKRESYKGLSFWRGFGAVGVGISLSILVTGIMFKFMQLQGSGVMLTVGLGSCGIALIVVVVRFVHDQKIVFYRNMLIRLLGAIFIGVVMYFTPGTTMVGFFYRDHPDYVKAYKEYARDPSNKELMKKLDEEAQKLD